MQNEKIDTLIIGGGQAGLAMSEQLSKRAVPHLIIERHRLVERWRSERWDSLVANGPAWHDRFPSLEFSGVDSDSFPHRDRVVDYFETLAAVIKAPIRCGVEVKTLRQNGEGTGFIAETSAGIIEANHVVAATGPFQNPVVPPIVPSELGIMQIHSSRYRNPAQLPQGAVLVVGSGSSGSQIADELLRAGRKVYLSVSAHDRAAIRYRGKDFCWWLGVLGLWNVKTRHPGMEHVTIAVSGAHGGKTIDFRRFAERGMTLLGRIGHLNDKTLEIAPDLARNIANGDAYYLSLLDMADAYVKANKLDMPLEPEARQIGADPHCLTNPLLQLNLSDAGITSIVWATGYSLDFGWLQVDAFDEKGRPSHERGISKVPGLYFLGLPWLSRRASAFIFGVWGDAEYLADHINLQSLRSDQSSAAALAT
jgi:putative flavoprotein involved in K+ transport